MGPEAFLERVRKTVEEHRLLERGDRVLVALSGGVDSVVLLHVLLRLAPRYSLGVEAAHFHHGLRGDEADRDQAFVEHLCREWGVRLEVGRGEVAELARERGRGVEEAAREARYAFLRTVMEERGLSPLAVAHTLSDAVETFFMRLIKGASPYGLRGILPRKGEVVRPLIDVTREEVEEYARIHGLSYVEDSTNRDLARFRNWVRWRLLPLLKEQNPKVERAVGRFMEILREEDSLLMERARSIGLSLSREREGDVELSRSSLAELPKGMRRRVVLELIHSLGGDARWTHLETLGYLVEGEGEARVHLPGGLMVVREGENLRFTRELDKEPEDVEVLVPGPGIYSLGEYLFHFQEIREGGDKVVVSPWSLLIDRDKVDFPMIIRYKRPGDVIYLEKVGHKKLQDLFVDAKVPRRERGRTPLLVDSQGRILWIPGLRWDARVLAGGGTKRHLLVAVRRGACGGEKNSSD